MGTDREEIRRDTLLIAAQRVRSVFAPPTVTSPGGTTVTMSQTVVTPEVVARMLEKWAVEPQGRPLIEFLGLEE